MKRTSIPQSFPHKQRRLSAALATLTLAATSTLVLLLCLQPASAQAPDRHVSLADVQQTPEKLIPAAARKSAPDFTLIDAHGQPITLSRYKGKVVLLDFWATWCGGCKLEIPWYMEFDRQYKSQGLAVIGVSMDAEGWKKVRPFLAQKKDEETGGNTAMQYPVVIGSDSLAKQFGLRSMPLTLLIDRNGKIAVSHTGVVDKDNFQNLIRQLLQQPAA
ncbi:MAG TPA: TlpA disulfide reductase family protein [Acidobacteriaceae bacterium]|jgi:cytochrome c biogenesis protein CcmG/thiol:disulfide interchange protein DsbE|nr:TlpA disulfide reductase family protein [Acidobacteriaceae bacterium]